MGADPAWLTIDCEGERRHVRLDLRLTTVGRNEANVIDLPDKKLSRFHCEIERKEGAEPASESTYVLRDCDSRNGTKLNGARIKASVTLAQGDAIEIGASVLLFRTERPIDADPGNNLIPIASLPKSLRKASTVRKLDLSGETPEDSFDPRPTIPIPPAQQILPPAQQILPPPPPPPTLVKRDMTRPLVDAIAAFARAASSDQVLGFLVQRALELVPARQASVLLPVGQGVAARVAAVLGHDTEARVDPRYSSAMVDEVLSKGLPVSVQDLKQDLRWGTDYSVLGLDLRGAIAVPLRALGKTRGVLYVDEPVAIFAAEREEAVRLLGALADAAGASLVASGGTIAVDEAALAADAARAGRLATEALPPACGLDLALRIRPGAGAFAEIQALPEHAGRRELAVLAAIATGSPLEVFRLEVAARTAFRALAHSGPRGGALLAALAVALGSELEGRALRTAVFRLDPLTGELRVALAGLGPVLHRARSGEVIALEAPTLALGATLSPSGEEHAIAWEKGDLVLLASPAPTDVVLAPWLAGAQEQSAAVMVERAFAELPQGAAFVAVRKS